MLQIYSPSGSEQKIGAFVENELRKLGFALRRDAVGNVIGEIGDGSPSVLLCGHMDTVPGELPVRLANGRLFGRGAVDAKSSLASMIAAVEHLDGKLPCRVVLAAVVDEEGKGSGIKQLIKDGVRPDYVVFGEPSGLKGITVGYKGSLHLKVTFATRPAHSASPWLAQSAVELALEFWSKLRASLARESAKSKFHSITGCLTKISGGSDGNFVPSECTIKIDVRIPPELSTQLVLGHIQQRIDAIRQAHTQAKAQLEVEDTLEAFESPIDSPLVRSFSFAIRDVTKKSVEILRKTGSSDMNVLGNKYGVPSVAYGPGDSRLDHTNEENVSVDDYLNAIRVYDVALSRLSTLHRR